MPAAGRSAGRPVVSVATRATTPRYRQSGRRVSLVRPPSKGVKRRLREVELSGAGLYADVLLGFAVIG